MQLKFALILTSLVATSVLSHPIDSNSVQLAVRDDHHCHYDGDDRDDNHCHGRHHGHHHHKYVLNSRVSSLRASIHSFVFQERARF